MWTAIKSALSIGLTAVAPLASAVLEAFKILWISICSAALWCGRQACKAPAWTAVLIGVVVLVWWLSGGIGYRRGHIQGETDGKAVVTADLNHCHTNVGRLEAALSDQSAKIAAMGKQSEALKADATAKVAKAQAEAAALRVRLAALLAAKPAGKTECERAASARRQIEGDLGL